jgi:hypothetical protein
LGDLALGDRIVGRQRHEPSRRVQLVVVVAALLLEPSPSDRHRSSSPRWSTSPRRRDQARPRSGS